MGLGLANMMPGEQVEIEVAQQGRKVVWAEGHRLSPRA